VRLASLQVSPLIIIVLFTGCLCATRSTLCTLRDHHFYRSTVAILTVFFSFFCTKRIIFRHFAMISDDHVSFSLSPFFTVLVCFPCTLLFFLLYLAIPCSAILLIFLFFAPFPSSLCVAFTQRGRPCVCYCKYFYFLFRLLFYNYFYSLNL
jgi:hypothetical protein